MPPKIMVNRYVLIKKMQSDNNLGNLVASGIISISIPTWLQIYETFLNEKKEYVKVVAIQNTADFYNLSNSQIYKIISFMTK